MLEILDIQPERPDALGEVGPLDPGRARAFGAVALQPRQILRGETNGFFYR
jgi:hypothetical protein